MKKIIQAAIMMAVLCCISASCQKEDESAAPVLPPVETLAFDFSQLPIATATKAGDDIDPAFTLMISPITNILYDIWDHLYQAIVNVPVGGFEVIAGLQPVENGNGQWIWESNFTEWGQKYGVKLIGTDAGKDVNWELQVSHDGLGSFENYTWIKGWSKKDGSEGEWNITVGPRDTDVIVKSNWKANGNTVENVKFTYSLDHRCGAISEFFNGSVVEYKHAATDPAYDSTLTMQYGQNVHGLDVNAIIEWNSTNGKCRIQCNKFVNPKDWYVCRTYSR